MPLACYSHLLYHLGMGAEKKCPTPLGQGGGEHSCWRQLQHYSAWPAWAGTLLSHHTWLLTAGTLVPPGSWLLTHVDLLGWGE